MSELHDEVWRKAITVSPYLFIQAPGWNPIEAGKVRIEQHPFPTNDENAFGDVDCGFLACAVHASDSHVVPRRPKGRNRSETANFSAWEPFDVFPLE
jgi:hypothetical protein